MICIQYIFGTLTWMSVCVVVVIQFSVIHIWFDISGVLNVDGGTSLVAYAISVKFHRGALRRFKHYTLLV